MANNITITDSELLSNAIEDATSNNGATAWSNLGYDGFTVFAPGDETTHSQLWATTYNGKYDGPSVLSNYSFYGSGPGTVGSVSDFDISKTDGTAFSAISVDLDVLFDSPTPITVSFTGFYANNLSVSTTFTVTPGMQPYYFPSSFQNITDLSITPLTNLYPVQFDGFVFGPTVAPPPQLPDLIVQSLTLGATSLPAGASTTVSYHVENAGNAAAGSSISNIYLSTQPAITTSDELLKSVNDGALPIGSYSPDSASIKLPSNLAPGKYWIGVIADANGEVTESEPDNFASIGITVTAAPVAKAQPVQVSFPIAASDKIVQGNRSDPGDLLNDHGTSATATRNNIPLQWAYDFVAKKYTPVNAVAAGTIVYVYDGFSNTSSFGGYGNVVTIKSTVDGHTFFTTYAHLAGLDGLPIGTSDPIANLSPGQSISAGQEIALSGSTGAPGEPHLHVQFGTAKYSAYLHTGDISGPIGVIANGENDAVAPAFFPVVSIDFRNRINATDRIYNGIEGSDQFVANTNGDTIVTYGGSDSITLDSISTLDRRTNHVEVYGGASVAIGTPGKTLYQSSSVVPARAGSIVDTNDFAQGGFWGVKNVSSEAGGLAANTGTSADISTIYDFKPGASAGYDILDLSVSAWGSGGTNSHGGVSRGLTAGNLVSHPSNTAAGTRAVIQEVSGGQSILPTADIIELTGAAYAGASAVVSAVHSGSFAFTFSDLLPVMADAHVLIAYNDLGGSTRIMDLELINTSGQATAHPTAMTEYGSDLVRLANVSASALMPTNIHFVS